MTDTNETYDPSFTPTEGTSSSPVASPEGATYLQDGQNQGQESRSTRFDPKAVQELVKAAARSHTVIMKPDAEVHSITDVKDALVKYDDIIPSAPKLKVKRIPKTGITQKWMDQFLPWVETYWHKFGQYPQTQTLMQEFGIDHQTVVALNCHKPWLKCLDRRGIQRPDVMESFLSDKQVAAIALITNVNDQRHQNVKLAAIGVSLEQYNGWLQNTTFKRALTERSENAFNNAGVDANLAIATLIKNNDFRATKFYMEMTGKAETPEQINVKRILQITIEAVQKHVKDPSVLRAIGAEIQAIREIEGLK